MAHRAFKILRRLLVILEGCLHLLHVLPFWVVTGGHNDATTNRERGIPLSIGPREYCALRGTQGGKTLPCG